MSIEFDFGNGSDRTVIETPLVLGREYHETLVPLGHQATLCNEMAGEGWRPISVNPTNMVQASMLADASGKQQAVPLYVVLFERVKPQEATQPAPGGAISAY